MTNLEKIQAMAAGEMASFLNNMSMHCCGMDCDNCQIGACRDLDYDGECHLFSMKKWLESEAV